ncbi:MAG TPA: AAA family ATPase [Thermoflexales bacterium]|nr:AAA family ATPase [Thermoflexales bacterium]
MKLVIIYGAEASGKLTVARALAQRTGYRVSHNHLSADLATSVFEFGSPGHSELVVSARALVFQTAAKYGVEGVIFTWAFSYPDFMPHLERIRAALKPYDTQILYVHLFCSDEERRRRVLAQDRKKFGKVNTLEQLEAAARRKRYGAIPDTNSLEIDNTHLDADAAAERIIAHFGLPSCNL